VATYGKPALTVHVLNPVVFVFDRYYADGPISAIKMTFHPCRRNAILRNVTSSPARNMAPATTLIMVGAAFLVPYTGSP
jgi:hypothetical protein